MCLDFGRSQLINDHDNKRRKLRLTMYPYKIRLLLMSERSNEEHHLRFIFR